MASSNPEIFLAKTTNWFLESDWFPAKHIAKPFVRDFVYLIKLFIYVPKKENKDEYTLN